MFHAWVLVIARSALCDAMHFIAAISARDKRDCFAQPTRNDSDSQQSGAFQNLFHRLHNLSEGRGGDVTPRD